MAVDYPSRETFPEGVTTFITPATVEELRRILSQQGEHGLYRRENKLLRRSKDERRESFPVSCHQGKEDQRCEDDGGSCCQVCISNQSFQRARKRHICAYVSVQKVLLDVGSHSGFENEDQKEDAK